MSNTEQFGFLKIGYVHRVFLVVIVHAALSRCSRQKVEARASGEGGGYRLVIDCIMNVLVPFDTLGLHRVSVAIYLLLTQWVR